MSQIFESSESCHNIFAEREQLFKDANPSRSRSEDLVTSCTQYVIRLGVKNHSSDHLFSPKSWISADTGENCIRVSLLAAHSVTDSIAILLPHESNC
jgi:hypothetical protein